MSLRMYFWKDEKVFTISVADWAARSMEQVIREYQMSEDEVSSLLDERGLHDCFCVDSRYSEHSRQRYGRYEDSGDSKYWVGCRFSEFPNEFQLALTVLGIS